MTQNNNTRWIKPTRITALSIFMFLVLIGCSKNATDPQQNEPETIGELIASVEDFEDVVPSEVVVDSATTTFEEDGTVWQCETKTISLVSAPNDFPNFNPNASVVFPGNLLQGKSLDLATPEPISTNRAPGTIVLTTINADSNFSGSYSETVDEISLSQVIDAQNRILSNNQGPLAANFSFTMEEVSSEQQLSVALKAKVDTWTTSLKAAMRFSSGKRYNRFLVKLTQQFYTMAYELPAGYDEVFAPGVTMEQLRPFIGPGNPATFISSVTYGRIFYMLIESTESKTAMQASIDASFRAAVANGSLGANVKYVNQLSDRVVKAYALGGDSQLALDAVIGGFDQLRSYLTQGADVRTGQQLSYEVRALKQPYPVVKSKIATEYTVQDCTPIALNSQNEIFWYRADTLLQQNGGQISEWGDAFGLQNKAVYVNNNGNLPVTVVPNIANGKPALRFWSANSLGGDYFTNSPAHLVNTNYTLFAVVNSPKGLFMWGNPGGNTSSPRFQAGFHDENTLRLQHDFQILDVNTSNLGDFQLFTFVFDVQNGMTVYENGVRRGTAAGNISPLTNNNGASIGVHWGSNTVPAYIADIRAYGEALADSDRAIMEEIIMRRYGLGAFGN